MATVGSVSATPASAEDSDTALRLFGANLTDADLSDVKRRPAATRSPALASREMVAARSGRRQQGDLASR
jgi:hypothetical protein